MRSKFSTLISADIDRFMQDSHCKHYLYLALVVDFWPVFLLRLEEYCDSHNSLLIKPLKIIIVLLRPIVQMISGTRIYRGASIGKGLLLHASVGIVITPKAIIGENCTIYSCATIAHRADNKSLGAPVIGRNVKIMSGAKIVGPVQIGDNSIVGANCVVTRDMPANTIATGNPANYRGINGK